MAQLGESFRPDEVEDDGFQCLPAGEYLMQVVASSLAANKKNTGSNMTLECEVLDGPSSGRKMWQRLSYTHENAQTQTIARQTLKKITDALGIVELHDTDDLHFKPFYGKVKVRADKSGQYSDSNDISAARSVNGGATPPQGERPAPRRQAPAGGGQQSRGPAAGSSRFGGMAAPQGGQGAGRGPWPGSAHGGSNTVEDDDIPF